MSRHHHYRKLKEPPSLDITSFLNLMVVLVPFLLITAVFSRISILHLNLPSDIASENVSDKKFHVQIVVRKDLIDIDDGKQLIQRIPNDDQGLYDVAVLRNSLKAIKSQYPEKRDSIVLMEADLEYQVLVMVMDAVSTYEQVHEDGSREQSELFPQISIGDAPNQPIAMRIKDDFAEERL